MADQWVKRWKVLSESSDSVYTVALHKEGHYGCSCPHWKFRRKECKHIRQVLDGDWDAEPEKREPSIILANVREVKLNGDGELLVPLLPLGDTHFEATLIYDLLQHGVSWRTIKGTYSLAKLNARKNIITYVEQRGRLIYGPWIEERGYTGRSIMPVEET